MIFIVTIFIVCYKVIAIHIKAAFHPGSFFSANKAKTKARAFIVHRANSTYFSLRMANGAKILNAQNTRKKKADQPDFIARSK